MSQLFTHEDLIQRLRDQAAEAGSLTILARRLGVTTAWVQNALAGGGRAADAVPRVLGYRPIILYELIEGDAGGRKGASHVR